MHLDFIDTEPFIRLVESIKRFFRKLSLRGKMK